MRIAVDARSLTSQPTGVGHYLMAALNVWSEQRPDIDFVLLGHKPLHPCAAAALRAATNMHFECAPARLAPANGLWWLVHAFARRARELNASHLWGAGGVLPWGGMAGLVTLLTVHDLVFRDLPQTMAARSRIAYGLLAGRSIRNADVLWAVSDFTASEIERTYPRRRAHGIAVGSGLNPMRQRVLPTTEKLVATAERYDIHDQTLLFVGTLEPRKNLAFMLSLMPELARRNWRLLIVGCAGWRQSALASQVHGADYPRNAVRFCDYVPDDDLQALYRCATFFISTSLMEGFGLPHLEAMEAGCPVIAAANSAVVEVVGDGGCLVDGWSTRVWIDAIEQALARRPDLKVAAVQTAARHSIAPACAAVSAALASVR